MDRTNEVQLEPLEKEEREEFIRQVQQAFDKGAQDVFGKDIPPAIPRKDVEESLDDPRCKAYHILCQGKVVGGAVVRWEEEERRCGLELLFIRPEIHGRGLGQSAWQAIQEAYPHAQGWETHTPYFDKRNIHFYVNKCGFHIVEFYCEAHPSPHAPSQPIPGGNVFFRFEKQMAE